MTNPKQPPSRAEVEAQALWEASGATDSPGLKALNATRPWGQRTRREHIEANLDDAVTDLLYYDRKGDETLPVGAIEEAVAAGEITVDEMVALFAETLRKALAEGV